MHKRHKQGDNQTISRVQVDFGSFYRLPGNLGPTRRSLAKTELHFFSQEKKELQDESLEPLSD